MIHKHVEHTKKLRAQKKRWLKKWQEGKWKKEKNENKNNDGNDDNDDDDDNDVDSEVSDDNADDNIDDNDDEKERGISYRWQRSRSVTIKSRQTPTILTVGTSDKWI